MVYVHVYLTNTHSTEWEAELWKEIEYMLYVFMNNIVMTHVRACVHVGVQLYQQCCVFARIIEGKEGV